MSTKIQVGSSAFFSQYEDFKPSDNDFVEFHDDAEVDFWVTDEDGEHIFHFRNMEKIEFIKFEFNRSKNLPLVVSKFIVPEIIEYLGITIEDLITFIGVFDGISKKHKYVKFIFECYLKNGDFTLTNEQRDEAYYMYKVVR